VGFTRSQLESFRGGTLPDLLGPDVRLLFVGINPGLWTVATQSHFGRRGNRFYPALFRAGITDRVIDASAGFVPEDVVHLLDRGIGITSLVAQATARADELTADELLAGALDLRRRVERVRPAVVAMLGITAYRIAFNQRRATVGRQPEDLGGSQLWVVPNPSGLNAHATAASLGAAYREVAVAAGIDVYPRSPDVYPEAATSDQR
jgi:TDG/mug DNA glycosylase family protein